LKQSVPAVAATVACWLVPSGVPLGAGVVQPFSLTLAMSKTGSRCTSVRPAWASAARWRMPLDWVSVKARYLPRRAAGTLASLAEKSRTCSS
jgi:hypothetical protein